MKKIKLFLAAIAAMVTMGVNAQTWTGNDVAAGNFYLYNIGTGKWLSSGNSWGTQASLVEAGGFYSTLELSDGKYAIKNTETRTNDKTAGPGYLGTGGFMDAENAAYFTFTAATRSDGVKAYYIQDGSNNLSYSGTGTTVVFNTETGDNAQWVLVSKQDRLNAMANADDSNPVDATFLLKNAEFGRYKLPAYDAAWTWTFPDGENKNNAGDNTNFCVESYHKAFDFAQTVADAPKGYYAVRGQAFYRQDGSNNTDLPYFYVGDAKVTFPAKTGSENSMSDASTSFTTGSYMTNWSAKTTYAGGDLKVGTHLDNNTALWCIWDNIQIQYYGPIDLSSYVTELANAVSAAQAYESQLPDAVYANIASVITANNKSYETSDEYSAAITAINNAVSTYATAAIVADYARYQNVKTAATSIASGLDTSTADTEVAAATTNDAIDAAIATLRAAFLAELPNVTIPETGLDVTAVMVDNAGVHTNTDFWTIANLSAEGGSAGVCNYGECEFYNRNFKFYQTLALTPGTWEFGVTGFHRGGQGDFSTYFYAGEDKILIPGVESSVVNTMAQAQTYFNEGNGKVALKFLIETAGDVEIGIDNQDTQTDKWTIFRDFTLKYYGAPDYTVYEEQWAALVEEANTAKTTHVNVTGTELTALNAAIEDSPAGSNLKATYTAKINALQAAIQTFNAAAPSYDAYVAYKAETIALWGSDFNVAAPSTAAEAVTAVQNLKVAQYNKVANDYTFSLTSKIGDFSTWTGTAQVGTPRAAGTPNSLNWEHWSGVTHPYYEQDGNGYNNEGGWTIQYTKTTTLPAGSYVVKVAARSSAGVTSSVTCTALPGVEISLPCAGNRARGINTSGAASWSDSDTFIFGDPDDINVITPAVGGRGGGWEWRFLPFSLTEETEVTMTFYAETNMQYNWMSIADGTLLSKQEIQNEVELTDADEAAPEAQVATSVITDRKLLEGLNTVIFPFETTATELGATTVLAYTGTTEEADGLTLNFKEVAPVDGKITLQANTPYAVMVDADQTENLAFGTKNISPSGELTVTDANNEFNFVGTYTNLAKGNKVVVEGDYVAGATAFKKAKGGNRIAAYRAYLKKVGTSNVANVKFNFGGDVVDGIEALELLNKFSADGIFNLQGQKVNNAQKGVYIVNGKKIVVK